MKVSELLVLSVFGGYNKSTVKTILFTPESREGIELLHDPRSGIVAGAGFNSYQVPEELKDLEILGINIKDEESLEVIV